MELALVPELRNEPAAAQATLAVLPTGGALHGVASPIVAVNVPRERTPKLKTPDDFNPTLKSDEVDSWLDCATRYLANFPSLTTKKKIYFGAMQKFGGERKRPPIPTQLGKSL